MAIEYFDGPLENRPEDLFADDDLCDKMDKLATRPTSLGTDLWTGQDDLDLIQKINTPNFYSETISKSDHGNGFHLFSEPPTKRSRISGERRRGRPRKEEVSENEDMRTVAKRMYARAYRENQKSRYVETEEELKKIREDYAELQLRHEKLEKLVEQCNFCTSSWALVKTMNIDPAVLRMAYDTLVKRSRSSSPSPRRSCSQSS
uniref:BZIP domain-containing protein n=1 Tax=Panagrolaimus sp. JU765 TaxID=591449 RepID=A0AC34RNT8_9BILA